MKSGQFPDHILGGSLGSRCTECSPFILAGIVKLHTDFACMQVCLRRYGMQQRALSEHWAGSAAGLRAREDADMAGEGGTVEDDVIFVGSQGALLGAVEV